MPAGAAPPQAVDVSVVMPVRNGEPFLASQLEALSATDFEGSWEVLLVDNGSTDRTCEIAHEFEGRLPLRLVDGSDHVGISHARNAGIAEARGRLVAFCDADDEVDRGWVAAMHRASLHAEVLGGRLDVERLNPPALAARHSAAATHLPMAFGVARYGVGANLGALREVLREVGGFDVRYTSCGDDVDLCWRAQLAGYHIAFVADAVVHYRLRDGMRRLARQQYAYGQAEAALFRSYRHLGLRRSSARSLASTAWFLLSRVPFLAGQRRRALWVATLASEVGRVAGGVRERFPHDFTSEEYTHWLVGWVETGRVRVLRQPELEVSEENLTDAFFAVVEWKERLDGYPVADESHYSELEWSEFQEWVEEEARYTWKRDHEDELPADLDYMAIGGLSTEVRQKLAAVRPASLGQAGRIDGITPASRTRLLCYVRRRPAHDGRDAA